MLILFFLFATGLCAGTVDAIAGGGGLISLPVLLSMGVPPHIAFGTNKLQGTLGTLVATKRYHRQGWISFKKAYKGILAGLVGSVLGSCSAQLMNSDILRKLIPILLSLILVYTLISPKLGVHDEQPRMQEKWFLILFGFCLGFYDGFFGPGVGSIWMFCLTFFLGYNLVKATAYAKVFNLNSSLVATICFVVGGNVDYRLALCMAAGQLIGGRLGANLAIKQGARLIRPLFLLIVACTITTMIYRTYASSVMMAHLTREYGIMPQVMVGVTILLSVIYVYRRRFHANRANEIEPFEYP